MAKEYLKRIEALRKQYLETRVDMDVYSCKCLTEELKESGTTWIIKGRQILSSVQR